MAVPGFSFRPRGQFPPKTNAQRQREFRQRNPDYYRILQAKRRAPLKAMKAQRAVIQRMMFELSRMPLMLPAPIEAIEIPGVTVPKADRERQHAELRT